MDRWSATGTVKKYPAITRYWELFPVLHTPYYYDYIYLNFHLMIAEADPPLLSSSSRPLVLGEPDH